MALWGAEVKTGEDYIHKSSTAYGRLRITRATLGTQNNLGSSRLKARAVERQATPVAWATLCTLDTMNVPTCGLDIELEEDVIFSVDGDSVCLSGYYIHAKTLTCTVTRPTPLKGRHQEMPDKGKKKKVRREDGKSSYHESNEEERNDVNKNANATPSMLRSKKKAVFKKPNYELISDTDNEKETTSKAKEQSELNVETTIEGRPGAKVATAGSEVRVKFVGCFRNGEVFDRHKSYQFKLGAGTVIRGWEEGIIGMLVGEERRLTIPPSYGYGDRKQVKIPPNSWLIYTITLLEVEQTKRRTDDCKDARQKKSY